MNESINVRATPVFVEKPAPVIQMMSETVGTLRTIEDMVDMLENRLYGATSGAAPEKKYPETASVRYLAQEAFDFANDIMVRLERIMEQLGNL